MTDFGTITYPFFINGLYLEAIHFSFWLQEKILWIALQQKTLDKGLSPDNRHFALMPDKLWLHLTWKRQHCKIWLLLVVLDHSDQFLVAQQPILNCEGNMRFSLLQWVWIREIEATGKQRVYEVLFLSWNVEKTLRFSAFIFCSPLHHSPKACLCRTHMQAALQVSN